MIEIEPRFDNYLNGQIQFFATKIEFAYLIKHINLDIITKPTNAMIKIRNIEYVSLHTGYTSRLVEHIIEIQQELTELCGKKCNLVYIYDDCWGDGLYPISEDAERIYDEIGNSDGVICMRCSNISHAFTLLEIIARYAYCANLSAHSLDSIHFDENTKVLTLEFDTESG